MKRKLDLDEKYQKWITVETTPHDRGGGGGGCEGRMQMQSCWVANVT